LLIAFCIYKLLRRRSKNSGKQQSLSEGDLKPFLESLNVDLEEKVREQWLISLFAFQGISALSILLTYFRDDAFNEFSVNIGPGFSVVFGFFICSLSSIPWFWFTSHCPYKRRGTAWLMWTMILLPLGHGGWNHVAAEWETFGRLIGLLYWINCLPLYRVNSAREYQRVLAFKAKYGPDANGFCS